MKIKWKWIDEHWRYMKCYNITIQVTKKIGVRMSISHKESEYCFLSAFKNESSKPDWNHCIASNIIKTLNFIIAKVNH